MACVVLLAACAEEKTQEASTTTPMTGIPGNPLPAGNRKLGVAPVPAIDAGETFADVFASLDGLGASYIEPSFQWDEIEISPGNYTFDDNAANLNAFLPQAAWHVSLAINAIDTNNDRRPAAYRQLQWDDPILMNAYWVFLQTVVDQFPNTQIDGIAIGNEVDVYLRLNPGQQQPYVNFVQEIQRRLKAAYPNFKNGVKTTVSGALNANSQLVEQLNETTDVIMSTYYAINANTRALSTAEAIGELESYVALFPEREIHFIEMGAMSSTSCGSSNQQQADFIQATFKFWDENVEQIGLINYLWLSDLPATMVDGFVDYYGVSEPCFREYLATLGLRDAQGVDKGAFNTLKTEAETRGF